MPKSYLDKDGLLYFWQKIKSAFLTDVSYNSTSKKIQKTKNGTTSDVVTLATVATSGSYSDLSNKPSNATTSTAGFMSSTDKTKLDGIATGAEVNQNAFSNVKVGSTTVAADGKTDTLELVAGTNITLTPDATNDKVTIAASSASATATTLETARAIDGVDFNGSADIIHYGECSTAAATTEKAVACTGYKLVTGSVVYVKFTVTNTGAVASLTLNVNSTGAKSIKYRNANLSSAGVLAANRLYCFVYDGTNYQLVGDLDTNTTYTNASLGQGYGVCSTGASTAAKTVTMSNYALVTGGIVSVLFTASVPANATLNINSKGAKEIWYRNGNITANIIEADDIATFIYDGTQYQLLTVDASARVATTSHRGLMSKADAVKLNGIAAGAEVNQNAFSNVKVGSTTIEADSKTDALELVAGSNVTLTPDATNDTVTIAATDTTYSEATTSVAGLMSASDKTKLNGIATGAEVNQNAFSNVKVGSTTVAADGKTDTLELVAGTNITLTPDATNDTVTIAASTSSATATTLETARNIDGVSFNGSSDIIHFGTSTTGPSVATKAVDCAGFNLATGSVIYVRFTSTNTADGAALNVNNTGAKTIKYRGAVIDNGYIEANRVYCFVYDADQNCYHLVGDLDRNRITITGNGNVVTNVSSTYGALTVTKGSTFILASDKGAASGVCPLNASSKIDSTYLPSYVDDVIEAYEVSGSTELSAGWLSATSGGSALTPETGKIYVLMADSASTTYAANSQFRWSGSAYVKLADGGVSSITNAEIDVIVAS